jgi:hypothetical protein
MDDWVVTGAAARVAVPEKKCDISCFVRSDAEHDLGIRALPFVLRMEGSLLFERACDALIDSSRVFTAPYATAVLRVAPCGLAKGCM